MYSLLETWQLNHRVNLQLLSHLSGEQLAYTAGRGRSIADQFAHLHNVRFMWLEVMAPAAARKLKKIGKGAATKQGLVEALETSAALLGELLAEAEKTGKTKSFKRGPVAFLGYMLAHEAHHRGQIVLHLKYAKMPVGNEVGYGLWDWDKL